MEMVLRAQYVSVRHSCCRMQCGVYIAHDPALRAGKGGEAAVARNSDIVEDLGLVRYVFSDKTGTLTANEMQLRGVAVRGATFGGGDVRCALNREAAFQGLGCRIAWRIDPQACDTAVRGGSARCQFLQRPFAVCTSNPCDLNC